MKFSNKKFPIHGLGVLVLAALGCSGMLTTKIDDSTWQRGPITVRMAEGSPSGEAWLAGQSAQVNYTPGSSTFLVYSYNPLQSDPVLHEVIVTCPNDSLVIEVLKTPGLGDTPQLSASKPRNSVDGDRALTLTFPGSASFFSYRFRNTGGCDATSAAYLVP